MNVCQPATGELDMTGRWCAHIHFVVQPVDEESMVKHDAHGPKLQAAMFDNDDPPDPSRVEEFAARACHSWNRRMLA